MIRYYKKEWLMLFLFPFYIVFVPIFALLLFFQMIKLFYN